MDNSLIVPVYKAESFLPDRLKEIDRTLSSEARGWELLLVVDASPDRSEAICRDFASVPRRYPIQVLVNERNLGKGGTVRRGMQAASGRLRIFTDCDGAYPLTEVLKVRDHLEKGADVVIASRILSDSFYVLNAKNFRRFYLRHLAGRLFNHLVNLILPLHCDDTQAGLKGFRIEAAEYLFSKGRMNGFAFDVELLYLARRSSLSIKEIPVHSYHQPSFTMNLGIDGLKMTWDLLRMRYWAARGRYK